MGRLHLSSWLHRQQLPRARGERRAAFGRSRGQQRCHHIERGHLAASTTVSRLLGTNYQVHTAGTGANVFTWKLPLPRPPPTRSMRAGRLPESGHQRPLHWQPRRRQHGGDGEPGGGRGQWYVLGTFSFNAGSATVRLSDKANDYVVADAVMIVPPGAMPNTATWTLNVPSAGSYQVYARWTQHPNRATDAKYTVNHAGGATQVTVNQAAGGSNWSPLGNLQLQRRADDHDADRPGQRLRYRRRGAVRARGRDAQQRGLGLRPRAGHHKLYARWTAHPNRATNATYTVTHAGGSTPVAVNQQEGGGQWNLLGTFSLTSSSNIALTDQANGHVIADAIRLVSVGQAQQRMYSSTPIISIRPGGSTTRPSSWCGAGTTPSRSGIRWRVRTPRGLGDLHLQPQIPRTVPRSRNQHPLQLFPRLPSGDRKVHSERSYRIARWHQHLRVCRFKSPQLLRSVGTG